MLRAELVKQLLRARSLVALAALAAIPVVSAIVTAGDAGGRNGTQSGLYGAGPFSALNHAAASMEFTVPQFLALVVVLFGSVLGAADRDWGTLRYLYVAPVGRRRVLIGKWSALAVCAALATACLVVAGALAGLVVFGWHPFHRIGAPSLSAAAAAVRLAGAAGYVVACMLSIGTVALVLGLLLPGPAEALGASVALLIVGEIVDGKTGLSVLPMHYWQRWTHLLEGGSAGLATGLAVQAATVLVALAVGWALLSRRDPVA